MDRCARWFGPVVLDVVNAHLAELDAHAPGLVAGFYLVGSRALGDVVARSDADFVAVVARAPTPGDLAALRGAHRRHRRVDGVYVRPDQLAGAPSLVGPVPHALGG